MQTITLNININVDIQSYLAIHTLSFLSIRLKQFTDIILLYMSSSSSC